MLCWANWPACSAAPAKKRAFWWLKTIWIWPAVIGDVFSRDTMEVQLAHTLQAALDACFGFKPHLLVLDIGLPDGDGFNVVDWLRNNAGLAHLPLVVYSGRELSPAECRQLTLGPTHFLTKTRVQPQQLEALVLTMLRNSRQIEETPAISDPG